MEFNPDRWANHRKGQRTRERIKAELAKNPYLSIAELARLCDRCERQIQRQLATIRFEERMKGNEPNFAYMDGDFKKNFGAKAG